MDFLLVSGGLSTGGFADSLYVDVIATAPPAAIPVYEPWTVPDAVGSMSGVHPWTPYIGSNAWSVQSGAIQLENSGTGSQGGRLEADLGTINYRVGADVIEFTHSGVNLLVASVVARMQGDSSLTFYGWDLMAYVGAYSLLLFRSVAGTQTVLYSASLAGAPVGINNIALEVNGDRLRGFYNGAQYINMVDSSPILTGHYAGIQGLANGVGNRTRMDNFYVRLPYNANVRRRRGLYPMTGVR